MIMVAWATIEPHFIGRTSHETPIFRARQVIRLALWSSDETSDEIRNAEAWCAMEVAPHGAVVVRGADRDTCMLAAEWHFPLSEGEAK